MPTPLGHALAGIGTGLLASGRTGPPPPGGRGPGWLERPAGLALLFAALACAPDLDLLVGNHNGPTHSVGAAVIVGLAVFAWTRRPRLALAAAAAYGSHVLLDWLNRDTSPPLGVMALWPFTREHFIAPWPVLPPVSRRYWLPGFWTHTLKVVLLELAVFGTFAAVVWWRPPSRKALRRGKAKQ
jgi:membrane-bound metal-dependent hydrolase YbcI (DUF457 family)